MQPRNNSHWKSTSSSLIQNKKIRSLYVVISSVVPLVICVFAVRPRGGGGGGVSELMDGRGGAILALELVPKNLIFA